MNATPASLEPRTSPSNDGLYLGIDAGGTKTVALLTGADGRVIGAGRAAACNIYDDVDAAFEQLDLAVRETLNAAGARLQTVTATCLSATGADWAEDFALFESALHVRGYQHFRVVNDAMGALRAGSKDGTGVSVVCGTAAGIGAKSASGAAWHTSFWQEPEGAEQLGRVALRAAYRAELGIDPPTSLTKALLEHHGVQNVEALLHAHTARGQREAQTVGKLARILLDEAANGDPTACRIVLEHGAALGDYAIVAARKVGLLNQNFALVTAGGVMRHASHLMHEALLSRVREFAPGAHPIRSPLEPVAGAVLLALETAGVNVTEALRENLRSSFPAAALFQT